jgi:hypothetical protein
MNTIYMGNFIDNKFRVLEDKIVRIKHIFFVNLPMYKKNEILIRIRWTKILISCKLSTEKTIRLLNIEECLNAIGLFYKIN